MSKQLQNVAILLLALFSIDCSRQQVTAQESGLVVDRYAVEQRKKQIRFNKVYKQASPLVLKAVRPAKHAAKQEVYTFPQWKQLRIERPNEPSATQYKYLQNKRNKQVRGGFKVEEIVHVGRTGYWLNEGCTYRIYQQIKGQQRIIYLDLLDEGRVSTTCNLLKGGYKYQLTGQLKATLRTVFRKGKRRKTKRYILQVASWKELNGPAPCKCPYCVCR